MFSDKLVEVISMDEDFVWIHDYHLMVLPSLLRKRFHRLRCGLFLHSPFPSSEIWRTFPKREELLRSLLNVDLIGNMLLRHRHTVAHRQVSCFVVHNLCCNASYNKQMLQYLCLVKAEWMSSACLLHCSAWHVCLCHYMLFHKTHA